MVFADQALGPCACSSLERYLHYLTRYEAHLTSLRMEETARMKLDRKIDTMLESDTTSLNHHDWLHTALEQLFLARRVMAYSYVFAFYMFGDMFKDEFTPRQAETNKVLFEDKQGQLEVEVEHLANLVENTPAAKMREERLNIINLASTINLRIMKMYEVIENEIAPQIAGRPLAVAPYRGRRSAADTRAEGTLEEAMGASLVVASEKTSMSELQTSPLNATSPVAKGTRLQKRARQK